MMSSDGEQAAITFDITSEADVSVLMRNRWDCFASIESVLDAPEHEAVADGKRVLKDGIKVINVDSETGRIKLTDTVTLKNVTANRTYTVVERLYSTSKAGDRNRFDQGYLSWESENGETWDYYA